MPLPSRSRTCPRRTATRSGSISSVSPSPAFGCGLSRCTETRCRRRGRSGRSGPPPRSGCESRRRWTDRTCRGSKDRRRPWRPGSPRRMPRTCTASTPLQALPSEHAPGSVVPTQSRDTLSPSVQALWSSQVPASGWLVSQTPLAHRFGAGAGVVAARRTRGGADPVAHVPAPSQVATPPQGSSLPHGVPIAKVPLVQAPAAHVGAAAQAVADPQVARPRADSSERSSPRRRRPRSHCRHCRHLAGRAALSQLGYVRPRWRGRRSAERRCPSRADIDWAASRRRRRGCNLFPSCMRFASSQLVPSAALG